MEMSLCPKIGIRGGQGALDRELQPYNAPHPVLPHRMEEGEYFRSTAAQWRGIDLSRELTRG